MNTKNRQVFIEGGEAYFPIKCKPKLYKHLTNDCTVKGKFSATILLLYIKKKRSIYSREIHHSSSFIIFLLSLFYY